MCDQGVSFCCCKGVGHESNPRCVVVVVLCRAARTKDQLTIPTHPSSRYDRSRHGGGDGGKAYLGKDRAALRGLRGRDPSIGQRGKREACSSALAAAGGVISPRARPSPQPHSLFLVLCRAAAGGPPPQLLEKRSCIARVSTSRPCRGKPSQGPASELPAGFHFKESIARYLTPRSIDE